VQWTLQKKEDKSYGDIVHSIIARLELARLLADAKRILIKPNFVTAKSSHDGVTTSIDLIREIVKAVKEISTAEIVVGESSLLDTAAVFKYLNVYDLEKTGCRVENFDKGEWIDIEPPFSLLFNRILIPRLAHESDFIINVSKMKTHALTGVTLGIKNFFGLLSASGRRYAHLKDINKGIVDVYSYFEANKKMVSIIDALVALSGKSGPVAGYPVKPDYLIAGTSTILCDAAATIIMGAVPDEIPHLKMSAELFHIDLTKSLIDGKDFADSTKLFEMPLMVKSAYPKWADIAQFLQTRLFYKYPVQKESQLCISCGRCGRICPKGIVSVNDRAFTYDRSECVHCLSCVEACNTDAITYKIKNKALFFLLRLCWRSLGAAKRLCKVSKKTGVSQNGA
jgi:uncharacterized protein (DUF362 family)/NAD-dependent dihydropyrimidine dehydrogenase PreA subunit